MMMFDNINLIEKIAERKKKYIAEYTGFVNAIGKSYGMTNDQVNVLDKDFLSLSGNEIQPSEKKDSLVVQLMQIVVKHNISDTITKDILSTLRKYGIDVPRTKADLLKSVDPSHFILNKIAEIDVIIQENHRELLSQINQMRRHNKDYKLREQQKEQPKSNFMQCTQSSNNSIQSVAQTLNTNIKRNDKNKEQTESIAMEVPLTMSTKSQPNILQCPENEDNVCNADSIISLPIQTVEDLEALDQKLKQQKYIKQFMKLVQSERPDVDSKFSNCGISRIFAIDVIMHYNWNGSLTKKSFKSLRNINKMLYEAWKGPCIKNPRDYVASIQKQLHVAKSRARAEEKRKNRKSVREKDV